MSHFEAISPSVVSFSRQIPPFEAKCGWRTEAGGGAPEAGPPARGPADSRRQPTDGGNTKTMVSSESAGLRAFVQTPPLPGRLPRAAPCDISINVPGGASVSSPGFIDFSGPCGGIGPWPCPTTMTSIACDEEERLRANPFRVSYP